MTVKWQPDITDKSLIDSAKAAFIYDSAVQYLKETLDVATTTKDTAIKAFGMLMVVISGLSGYLFIDCRNSTSVCSNNPHIITSVMVLMTGYIIAAAVILFKCLWAYPFQFNGNMPKNLLKTSVCKYDIDSIKIGTLPGMQERIENNVDNNIALAKSLNFAYLVSGLTPVLAGLASLL